MEYSFREYLYNRLIDDGYAEDEELDMSTMDADDVLEAVSDIGPDELQTYANTYVSHCETEGYFTNWDGFEDYEI